MTHPKTPINNVFGGSLHTFISAGYEPMRKAYDYDYLQTIHPRLKNSEEVYKFLDEAGIQVELARHELGLEQSIKNLGNEKFVKELASHAKGDKEIAPEVFRGLQKKYKLSLIHI